MDYIYLIETAIGDGYKARDEFQLNNALRHFDNALGVINILDQPFMITDVLLAKADVYMLMRRYDVAIRNITDALQCNSMFPTSHPDGGKRWLQYAIKCSDIPIVQLNCYSAALCYDIHDNRQKSEIHGHRAAIYHKIGKLEECQNDVNQCRVIHPPTAQSLGIKHKQNGIMLFQSNDFKKCILALQIAEKFLKSFGNEVREERYKCFMYLASALWQLKQTDRAIKACWDGRAIQSKEDQKEAIKWKNRGNDVSKERQYTCARECYTLAISFTPMDKQDILGTLYSNRSFAHLKMGNLSKAKQDAELCVQYRPTWTKSYFRLGSALCELKQFDDAVDVLGKGLKIQQSKDEQYELFEKMMDVVFSRCEDGAKVTFVLPQECLDAFLKKQVKNNNWKMIEFLFLGGGGQRAFAKGAGGLATGSDVSGISLNILLKKKPDNLAKLLKVFIDHGCSVNGKVGDLLPPLTVAVDEKQYEAALVLLQSKADMNGLLKCKMSKRDDAHVCIAAFRIGLLSDFWKIFCFLMDEHQSDNPDFISGIQDKRGYNLYHIVATTERMSFEAVETAIGLLVKYNVNPMARTRAGQTPHTLAQRDRQKDPRILRLIDESVKGFQLQPSKKKKKKKKKNKRRKPAMSDDLPDDKTTEELSWHEMAEATTEQDERDETSKQDNTSDQKESVVGRSEASALRESIAKAIDELEVLIIRKVSRNEGESSAVAPNEASSIQAHDSPPDEDGGTLASDMAKLDDGKRPLAVNVVDAPALNFADDDALDEDLEELFENLTWEVECTSDVWKTLRSKRLSRAVKERIVKIIHQLASGDMRGSLAIPLQGICKQNDVPLFEAKLSKGSRILWERAIAFSPRCSNDTELVSNVSQSGTGKIYSEIIRIWDVVLDHDTVPRKIEKIVQSHRRGSTCIIKKELKGFDPKLHSSSSTAKDGYLSVPRLFAHKDDLLKEDRRQPPRDSNEVSTMFSPPGCPEETEYHILKFYAFSNALVNAVLHDTGKVNVDFPFRVSELEHAVINLKPKASLLLLGRSGTGKTTCCLYRLWCHFQAYWQGRSMEDPGLPKAAPPIVDDGRNNDNDDCSEEDQQAESPDEECSKKFRRRSSGEVSSYQVCQPSTSKLEDPGEAKAMSSAGHRQAKATSNAGHRKAKTTSSASHREPKTMSSVDHREAKATSSAADTCNECGEAVASDSEDENGYEHLHQAFITKNAVLCTEVRKNFVELSEGCRPCSSCHEPSSSANRFDQLQEQDWPLFICSRDWLLMLDASLPAPAFFPRTDDGDLVRAVQGWGEEDTHLRLIHEDHFEDEDLDESEEDLGVSLMREDVEDIQTATRKDPRLEITYQVFKNELWPKMTKKRKVDYHPTLVWTEICSFIKGSVEALHTDEGYISLEEYQTLGRKRAPSFSADRETVYELFLCYQRIKHTKGMFDEADLVYHIYHRLQGNVPQWSMHEIYVDETQDFTQAEMSVIIRCCRDPNRLFFTGDTAQSIMRGVAFRFSDLKSLFYYMNESYKAVHHHSQVHVPDRVYQLTHNYRSHAGILNLASSVIDLLLHFFPESFDQIERDQGLFEGPKPVLLESCSFSDLAVILRGHQRKTTPIEFGAHQVILVASDAVRESLPEELGLALVMTIYEAKGLEFDDVLIYNFFKDSQAGKEWRVVNGYQREKKEVLDENEGIVEINEERLVTKTRPLDFDADRHKILISEFKYLYTALTRARVNVWLFDEDEEARAPMFEYFQHCEVVEVKKPNTADEDKLSGMFAEKSSEEEWRAQGHFFYKKDLWKVAQQCFTMGKDEHMVQKCDAQLQAVHAASLTNEPRKMRFEFLKAADMFFLCEMKDQAAICLHNARERLLLAKLYERCGESRKAARLFRKEKKFIRASENFEKCFDFMRAVDCLLELSCYDQALNVVARYRLLTQDGVPVGVIEPRYDQRNESICYRAAEYYRERGQLELMTSSLEKLPETKDRLTFLLNNHCYEQAASLLLKEGKPQEAAEMMRSNGEFARAADITQDDKFAAECHLLEARSVIQAQKRKENNSDGGRDDMNVRIEKSLERARELYEKCAFVDGQAEVKCVRGQFLKSAEDLEEARKLYFNARNHTGVAECFLMLADLGKDGRGHPNFRKRALLTVEHLFRLILALVKKKKENVTDITYVAMCERYFGLVDSGDPCSRKLPALEMARYSDLTSVKQPNDVVNISEAHGVILERLCEIACDLVKKLWEIHQKVAEQHMPCPSHLSGLHCSDESCNYCHTDLSRPHFAEQFQALCFLIHLDAVVASFLKKDLRRESSKVSNKLKHLILARFEFKACEWLYDMLFPKSGQLGTLYAASPLDISFIKARAHICHRIVEYARWMWHGAKEEARWTDSNLFILVSNLMKVAGAPVADVFNLLAIEERRFEKNTNGRPKDMYGFFRDKTKPVGSQLTLFSNLLEVSRIQLYRDGDIVRATQTAVKQFMHMPARRRSMPYPSIGNAVMILEHHVTACLMLYHRYKMDFVTVCLPENYLAMLKFWDLLHSRPTHQMSIFAIIQKDTPSLADGMRKLESVIYAMVDLMFGQTAQCYNIFRDALFNKSVSLIEAERALVLALTMLCNCGRGIPEKCEPVIREQFLRYKLSSLGHLPEKLRKCIEAVQQSRGPSDVVITLEKLVTVKPRNEKLKDTTWDARVGKQMFWTCKSDRYAGEFLYKLDEISHEPEQSSAELTGEQPEVADEEFDDFIDGRETHQVLADSQRNRLEDEIDEAKVNEAGLTIKKAIVSWLHRRRASAKRQERINNDPVEAHFQTFKLDMSGCTICGKTQFNDVSESSASFESHRGDETIKASPDNTFRKHCAGKSVHWRKEIQLKLFKKLYRELIFPVQEKAQQLQHEMRELKVKTVVNCSLDLARLEEAVGKLQHKLRKVEGECAWSNVWLIKVAVRDVETEINNVASYKGNGKLDVRERASSNRVEAEDSDVEYGGDDDGLHHLKDVNFEKRSKKRRARSRRRGKPT